MTLLELQSRVTKTGAFIGSGIDTSGITGDWTLKFQCESLSDQAQARWVFEDSVNGFTASLSGPAISFKGAIFAASDKVKSFKKADFPSLKLGVAGSLLRLKLADIDANASTVYRAWIEY